MKILIFASHIIMTAVETWRAVPDTSCNHACLGTSLCRVKSPNGLSAQFFRP